MTRTFVDAGVLIAAATGRQPALYRRAIAILDDPVRDFVASDFLRLEVLPKAIYTRR
jgi:predicted nucleic acid-binding protein